MNLFPPLCRAESHSFPCSDPGSPDRGGLLPSCQNAVLDAFPDAVISLSLRGKVRFWNAGAQKLFGYRAEEMFGLSIALLVPPESMAEAAEFLARAALGEIVRAETVRLRKGGEKVHVSLTAFPVYGADGTIEGTSSIIRDNTAQKEAEARLRESEIRFRETFENAAVGIAHVSPDGRWLRVNQRLCDMLGYSREEMQDANFREITHPDDLESNLQLAGQLLTGGIDSYSLEKRYLHRDGHPVWVRLTGTTCRKSDGEVDYFIVAMADITDLKRAEEELRRAKEEAEAGSRAKSDFLANMSHEIRTPMTVILASLEQLLQRESSPLKRQFLEMADEAGQRLLCLIDDMLDLSKIEARKLEIEESAFSLRQCAEKVVNLFILPAKEKGVQLRCTLSPELPGRMRGDSARIGQILINLIGNAVKFTDCGEVELSIRPDGDDILFSVRDTGIGIPAGKMDLLFRSFSQLDTSRSRRYGGSGLGLAVSRGLVECMGGTIWAESEEGQGSVFSFRLPLRPAPEEEAEAPPRALRAESVGVQVRILLAEDDPRVRELMGIILRRPGWQVTVAVSGKEALEKWRKGSFDVMLMDIQMPDMDGISATRTIREAEKESGVHTPIIALTAHARREDREECLRAGMDECLTKPVDTESLYAVVNGILATRRGAAQNR